MKPKQIIYTKADKVRFRSTPDAENSSSIIRELPEGQAMEVIAGPWIRVRIGRTEGWVHGDYITEERAEGNRSAGIIHALPFQIGVANLVNDALSIALREAIADEFGGGKNGWELQCTEYAMYRIKEKLGLTLMWPLKSGRHGGKWAAIFAQHGPYGVSKMPKENCAMCFTAGISSDPKTNAIGHVAFVEAILPDGSIKISEANWPRNGIYNERVLTKKEWKEKYQARFVHFG